MLCESCKKIEHCEKCGDEIVNAIPVQNKHITCFGNDPIPQSLKNSGWKIESHVPMESFDSSKLSIYFSPNQKDGKVIEGHKLRAELETDKVLVLNACVLDYLLLHPELIPEDWKKDENGNARYISFWGTVYRSPNGDLYVRVLYWLDGAWRWHYGGLDRDWDARDPEAVLASVPHP